MGGGSNVGNRFENLMSAWLALSEILEEPDFSSLWETMPLMFTDQPSFYNIVYSGIFRGSSFQLLSELHRIEALRGRNRSLEISKGPRTLDLDLLFFGSEVRQEDVLTLPHPGIRERAFVLYPLLELLPEDHPQYSVLTESLEKNRDQGIECIKKKTTDSSRFWISEETVNE
nr:2-amino-4-hydroxy-6-hydroxymethyldihydropteridine diphosphokinase [Oceanispirochaeta crateris]